MSDLDTQKRPQFELREDGEIHLNRKGQSQLLAKYDEERGIVTFESFGIDQKYRTQICRAIMENWESGELTGNAIKAYAIAGRPVDNVRPGEPLPPKKDKMMGDKTDAYVKWLFKWRPQAAYARYGVFLDSNGEPITAPCVRTEQGLLAAPMGTQPTVVMGTGSEVLARKTIEVEDGIIAMRGTCMTFTKQEMAGGAGDEDEDQEEPTLGARQTEEEPIPDDPGESAEPAKVRGKPGPKPKAQAVAANEAH